MTPNVDYSGCTAPLTSKRCILYIYSTNIGTENFKHGIYSPFFPLQNAVCFINLTHLVPVLFTFYIQDVLKLKKKNSGTKRLKDVSPQASQLPVDYQDHVNMLAATKTRVALLICGQSYFPVRHSVLEYVILTL